MTLDQLIGQILETASILVDVREKEEWKEGHIQGAYHLPFSSFKTQDLASLFPPHQTLYIYCKAGKRAEYAQSILKVYYPSVISISYSFEDLKSAFNSKIN